ncbi:MAG: EndoU domain-containing protein [Leptotrichiaceae bacterium]|nr:EndoU domain-containing protein [Leptotrichiaceae bacterium]
MNMKKTMKKIAEVFLIVILCVTVTKFFIGKEQQKNVNVITSQKNNKEKNSSENSKKGNRKNRKKNKKEYSSDTSNTGIEKDVTVGQQSGAGNRKYKIDYDHIIGGDINSSGDKVTGGHTLLRGDVRIIKRIGIPANNGVYRANVEIKRPDGKWQKKTSNGGVNTMFPENWDEKRVIDEINSAWENRKELRGRDSNMWQGISKSGVIIRGYKSPKITAYPIYEGDR